MADDQQCVVLQTMVQEVKKGAALDGIPGPLIETVLLSGDAEQAVAALRELSENHLSHAMRWDLEAATAAVRNVSQMWRS